MADSKKSDPRRARGSSAERTDGTRNKTARAVPARGSARDEERFALALESIHHGVYDWDVASNTVYYSPLLRTIFGMAEGQDLTPEESGARVHPDDVRAYRKAIVDHLKGLTPLLLVEYRYLALDNTWRWARQSGIAQRDRNGVATA